MKNNKGFTLVELLVAVAILGIIAIIALPQITNLTNKNKDTKYETYQKTIISAGKLYVDAYSEDMFGNNTSGCYDISYSELKSKNLVKNTNINNTKCDGGSTNKTFVRVYKTNDNYLYKASIYCVDKNNNVIYEDNSAGIYGVCDGTTTDTKAPTITINTVSDDWSTGKGEVAKITISDDYGLLENTKIKYAWTTTPDSVSESEYKTHNFKNNRKTETFVSLDVEVPQNKTGLYYLVVYPLDVRDANGNFQSTKEKKEVKLDNTSPTIPTTGSIGTVSGSNKNANIQNAATGSEDNHSGLKEYRYMITTTSDKPAKTNEKFTTSLAFTRSCGTSYYAWGVAVDNVGNISEVKSLGNTKDGADNYSSYSSCSNTCGSGTKTRTNTCALVTTGLSASCSSTTSCCDEVTYSDGDSCSASCGGGTKNQLAYSKKNPSMRCASKDKASGGSSCNTNGCCSKTEFSHCDNYGACSVSSCGGGTKKRTCYKKSSYTGEICSNYSDSAACNTDPCEPKIKCEWDSNTGVFKVESGPQGHWYWYNVVGYKSGTRTTESVSNYKTGYGTIKAADGSKWWLERASYVPLQGKTIGTNGYVSNQCNLSK